MRRSIVISALALIALPVMAQEEGPSNITCAAAIGAAQVILALDEQNDTSETRAELSVLTKARWESAISAGEAADLNAAQKATSVELERIMVPVLNGDAGSQEYLGQVIEDCLDL